MDEIKKKRVIEAYGELRIQTHELEAAIEDLLPAGTSVFVQKGRGCFHAEVIDLALHGSSTRARIHNHNTGKTYHVYVIPHIIDTY